MSTETHCKRVQNEFKMNCMNSFIIIIKKGHLLWKTGKNGNSFCASCDLNTG